MADVTYTFTYNPAIPHDVYKETVAISSDLDAGNDVVLTPHAKAISVDQDGMISIQEKGNSAAVPRFLLGGERYKALIIKVIAADTDDGINVVVYH